MEPLRKIFSVTALLTVPLTFFSTSIFAQQSSHQRNLLPGGRAASLGGAYTALSDDPSGGYYNPAGLSFAARSETSVSSNAYRESKTVYSGAIDGEDFVETSNAIYPSFLGAIYKWGSLTGGWSYMTVDSKNINQNHRFEDISSVSGEASTYSRTHQEVNNYIHAGLSLAWKITNSISLGTSVFYYRREIQSTNHQMTQFNGGNLLVLDFKYNTVNEGFVPVGGITWRGSTMSLGLSGRVPTAYTDNTKFTSDRVISTEPTAADPDADSIPDVTTSQGSASSLNESNPNSAQVGFAWFPSKWFLVTADVIGHGEVETQSTRDKLHTTFNYSLGLEFNVPYVSIRLGAFTNNSMYRQPDPDLTDQPTWIDFKGMTGGIGIIQKDREGTLSLVQQSGKGKSQIVTGSPEIQTVTSGSTTYMITGTVFF